MLKERPAVFEDDHPFMFLHQEHAEEVCAFLTNKHVEFRTLTGPGRTVKFRFMALSVCEVELLMMRLVGA